MRVNLLLGCVFMCFFAFSQSAIASDNFNEITNNAKIKETLNLLSTHSVETKKTLNTILGDNLTKRPIKIMFFEISRFGIGYENLDALTCKHKSGALYVFINPIHKTAPKEALACLLSHEVLHQDDKSSYEEEVVAWTTEARTWRSLKRVYSNLNNLSLNKYPLVKRLNMIEKMYVKANYTASIISKEVHGNAGYRGLPEYSIGYGI